MLETKETIHQISRSISQSPCGCVHACRAKRLWIWCELSGWCAGPLDFLPRYSGGLPESLRGKTEHPINPPTGLYLHSTNSQQKLWHFPNWAGLDHTPGLIHLQRPNVSSMCRRNRSHLRTSRTSFLKLTVTLAIYLMKIPVCPVCWPASPICGRTGCSWSCSHGSVQLNKRTKFSQGWIKKAHKGLAKTRTIRLKVVKLNHSSGCFWQSDFKKKKKNQPLSCEHKVDVWHLRLAGRY